MQSPVLNCEQAIERLSACEQEIHALGVARLALFGSVLRGQAHAQSDVDLLVQFAPGAKTYARLFAVLRSSVRRRRRCRKTFGWGVQRLSGERWQACGTSSRAYSTSRKDRYHSRPHATLLRRTQPLVSRSATPDGCGAPWWPAATCHRLLETRPRRGGGRRVIDRTRRMVISPFDPKTLLYLAGAMALEPAQNLKPNRQAVVPRRRP
jgi:hypothetical protein